MALKQRTTIRDVAERAGVSPATVSNHLNGKGRLGAETRERIRVAMDELHFTPNGLIKALQRRRTHVLGLLIGGMEALQQHPEQSITLPLLSGIYDAADAAAHDILLYTGWPSRPERSTGRDFLDGRVDGLLWLAPNIDSPALARMAAAGLPVVAMLTRRVPEHVAYIDAENVAGARALVEHLIAQGHRRIAFAGPQHASNFVDRYRGYREALAAAGIAEDPALVATGNELRQGSPLELRFGNPALYAALLDRWLALPEPPTAIFVCTDTWAARVAEAAAARGLTIPGDLALAGFDDAPLASALCGGLTTVRQPFAEVGRAAVEQMLCLVEGAAPAECSRTLPTQLVVRASTAAPRGAWEAK